MLPLPTYATLGHGPLVLLLHGSAGGWRPFAPQMEALAMNGFRAVAWDMPGYGHSPPIEPYGFKGLAERCAALIDTLAGAEGASTRVALVGTGMGGMVAQEVALRRPDRVGQLVLVASAAAVETGDAYARYAADALALLDAGTELTAAAPDWVRRWSSPTALPAGLRLAAHTVAELHPATWRRALQALPAFDRRAALAQLHAPTLVIAGQDDPVAPPAALRALSAAVPGSFFTQLPASGHWPNLEQPDAFDALLMEFLRSAPEVTLH